MTRVTDHASFDDAFFATDNAHTVTGSTATGGSILDYGVGGAPTFSLPGDMSSSNRWATFEW
ncbi:MAG: hypothetical protein R3F34_03315 [Planctomycetota bacterium]